MSFSWYDLFFSFYQTYRIGYFPDMSRRSQSVTSVDTDKKMLKYCFVLLSIKLYEKLDKYSYANTVVVVVSRQ